MRLHNPKTGITIYVPTPSDTDYTPESAEFAKSVMQSNPGDTFDVAFKKILTDLADRWDGIRAKRQAETKGLVE